MFMWTFRARARARAKAIMQEQPALMSVPCAAARGITGARWRIQSSRAPTRTRAAMAKAARRATVRGGSPKAEDATKAVRVRRKSISIYVYSEPIVEFPVERHGAVTTQS